MYSTNTVTKQTNIARRFCTLEYRCNTMIPHHPNSGDSGSVDSLESYRTQSRIGLERMLTLSTVLWLAADCNWVGFTVQEQGPYFEFDWVRVPGSRTIFILFTYFLWVPKKPPPLSVFWISCQWLAGNWSVLLTCTTPSRMVRIICLFNKICLSKEFSYLHRLWSFCGWETGLTGENKTPVLSGDNKPFHVLKPGNEPRPCQWEGRSLTTDAVGQPQKRKKVPPDGAGGSANQDGGGEGPVG